MPPFYRPGDASVESTDEHHVPACPGNRLSHIPTERQKGHQLTKRLSLLLAFHLVSGIVLSTWSASEQHILSGLKATLVIAPFALVFCQSSLLALWAVMSRSARWLRIIGLIGGSLYLAFLLRWAIDEGEAIPATLMMTVVVTCALLVVRQRKVVFRRVSAQKGKERSGLQFTIKGLMTFTLAVAVLITGAKQLREAGGPKADVFIVGLWVACFAVTSLASIWATLGLESPYARSIAAVIMSTMLGWCFAYGVTPDWDFSIFFYVMLIMFLQTALLVCSLLVVRSCGYRLVRHDPRQSETALPEGEIS
jgi:hypothetical protein